jgi:hypothetical protein
MASREYQTITRPDAEVVAAFKKIDAELTAGGQSRIQIHLASGHNQPFNLTLGELEGNAQLGEFLKSTQALAVHLQLNLPSVPKGANVSVIRQAGLDKVTIQFADQLEGATAAKFLGVINKHIPGFEAPASIQKILGDELQEFYARRDASLMRLEQLSQKLIEDNQQYRQRVDEEAAAERKKLEQEQQQRLDKLQQNFEEKDAALKQREESLETRSKELDDRASRHVRRQIRKEFLEKLASREEQFRLSKSTNTKRIGIHLQFWLLLIVAFAIGYFGFRAVTADPKDPYAYVRLLIGIIGFAAASVYYLRWTDRWFRQHADEEFRLRRLGLDFDRASWIVEMALEWKQEKQEEIPRELIDRLTANLFLTGEASEALRHPAEDLAAALLGASSSLKLNLPGGSGELNIDRKGMKSLR